MRRQAAGLRRMARLGQRVLDEGEVRLLGLGDAQLALRHQLQRQRREQRLQLGQLLGVVGRQHQPQSIGSCRERQRFCAATSSRMPLSASASSASISARVNGAPSAVPCTSTKPPAPVITTFMSVSQAESSVYSRSSSGVPSTMPTDTAATKSRIGDAAMLALRHQPAHRVVRGHEGAGDGRGARAAVGLQHVAVERGCVRSPSAFRSNTLRSERPIRRWISCVRPLCLPRAASRSLRVWVARGSMPYSAVTQPSPLPRLCGGTFSSTEAVHSTWVSPKLDQHRALGVAGVVARDA